MLFRLDLGRSGENVERLSKRLNRFAGELRTMGSLMERLRDEVTIPAVRTNFEGQTAAGNSWAALHPATFTLPRRRGGLENRPILNVTGRLFTAATAKARWTIDANIGDLFVASNTFATNVPYGYMQHEGGVSGLTGGPVPARPFYVLHERDIKRAEEVINDWIWGNYHKTIGAGDRRSAVWETVRM